MAGMTRRALVSGVLSGVVAVSAATTVGRPRPATAHDGVHLDDLAAGPTEHLIEIGGFAFQPPTVHVRPGDTVTWINRDIAPHTATADDDSWDTGAIGTGERTSLPVTHDMVATYYCRFHPMMTARLEIASAG